MSSFIRLLPIALITGFTSINSGCAFTKYARLMEPPVDPVDVAELSANVPEGYEMLFLFGGESVQPEENIFNKSSNELTVDNALKMIDYGNLLGQGEASIAADAFRAFVSKNRRYPMQLHLIKSADNAEIGYSKTVEIVKSFNESALKPGTRSLTNADKFTLDLKMAELKMEDFQKAIDKAIEDLKNEFDTDPIPPVDDPDTPVTPEEGINVNLIKESTNEDGTPSGRGAVVLVKSIWTGMVKHVRVGEELFVFSSVANGNREHWRSPSSTSLSKFVGSTAIVKLKDNSVYTHVVQDAMRDEGFSWELAED